jgi:hypothetical protein
MRTYKMSPKRIVIRSMIALGVVYMVWIIGVVAWNAIDEGATVPPDSAFQPVPPPNEIQEISTQCGSGGCSRVMIIETKPPQSAQALAAEMGVTSDRCGPINLLTLRKTCIGSSSYREGILQVYVQYSY